MVHYRLFTQLINDPEIGKYESYGISANDTSGETRVISDVTCDSEKAKRLVDLYNSEQLSISQLDEAIESFLYAFEV